MSFHPDWLTPDWPAPAGVRAVFTTRAGGVSPAPYASMNLGEHVQDHPAHVQANRQTLRQALNAQPVFMQQVHGVEVATLSLAGDPGPTPEADACLTREQGLACTVMVADCLPVLFTTRDGQIVAAAHAGWRGLCHGVLEQTLSAIRALRLAQYAMSAIKNGAKKPVPPHDVLAWLGPAIGPQAFEVGGDVRQAFLHNCPSPHEVDPFFKTCGSGKYLADLPGLARQRLAQAGVKAVYGNDGSAVWCTVSNPDRYFSHRRDSLGRGPGHTGRMAACIWRI